MDARVKPAHDEAAGRRGDGGPGQRCGGGAGVRSDRRDGRPVPHGRAFALHRAVSRRSHGARDAAPLPACPGRRAPRRPQRAGPVVRPRRRGRILRRHDLCGDPLSGVVGTGLGPAVGRADRRRGRHRAHFRGPAPHHWNGPVLHHDLLLRSGARWRIVARRVRRQVHSLAPAHLLFRVGLHRRDGRDLEDRRDRRGDLRAVRPCPVQVGRRRILHRHLHGADGPPPRWPGQDCHPRLVIVRHDLRQRGANVMTVGVVTIPLMIRVGYRPHLAAAIEANASTGGQIMPPVMGIAAFVMAEFLQVPYAEVALAAAIPAILFYIALFIQVDLEAARRRILPLDESQIPKIGQVLKSGWHFPIPFIVLVYALFWGGEEADSAGLWAIGTALVLAVLFPFRGKRIGLTDLYEMLRATGLGVLDLFMIGAASGIMIGALNYSGIGFTLSLVLIHLAAGSLILLLAYSAIANIILGAGLPTVGCYILLATLVAPSLIQMGIDPMAAHMFILYYGCLSMISPPVAVAAFVAANLANADPNKTGWVAMAFGWTIFVIPFLFVYSGTLLLKGDPVFIVIDFVTAVAGVWLISAAVMGYSVRDLAWDDRVVHMIAGICLIMPVGAFPGARWMNIIGAVMGLAVVVWERAVRRRPVEPQQPLAPVSPLPDTPVTAAEQRAMLDRLGIRGSGESE